MQRLPIQKTRNDGQWTEARYNSFIKGGLRSASQRWPPKYQTLNAACVGQQINQASGRLAKHYKCAACSNVFPAKHVEVNHIDPVIPTTGFDSWDNVIDRLFCEQEGLEVVCKTCHKLISKGENLERKLSKRVLRKE